MDRELIFSQVIPASDFSVNTDFGVPVLASYRYENDTPLIAEETYIVSWDGQEYECAAQDGSAVMSGLILIGNGTPVMLAGNNEPFIIGQTAQIPLNFFSLTDTQPTQHSVVIYQLVEDVVPDEPEIPDTPEEDTDGIVLHNRLNQPVVYGSYKKLLINRASGDKTIFSMGDAGEKTVADLDFKNGDMVVKPEKDKLFSQVTITKPDTLIAENIKKDVVVAGIKGTAEGNKPPVLNMEKTILPFVYNEGWGRWVYTGDGVTYIVPQARYVVEYNGNTFACKAVWVENINNGCAVLGNASIFGMEDTGEPFFLLNNPEGEMVVMAIETPDQSQIPVAVQMVSSSQLMLNDATLQFTLLNKNGLTAFANVDNDLVGLIPNLPYTVIWDGKDYPCKAVQVPGIDIMLMGRLPDFGLNLDYPFFLMYEAGVVAIISFIDMAESTHTVSVIPDFNHTPAYAMEQTTVNFYDTGGMYAALNPGLDMILPDVEYTVVWDGDSIVCTPMIQGDVWLLGNPAILDSNLNNQMPFALTNGIIQDNVVVVALAGGDSHTMEITPIFGGGAGGETIDPLMLEEVYSEITTIQANKFYADDIVKKVVLPKATSIGNYAFYHCSNLEYVNIPAAKSLGQNCFQMATKLVTLDTASLTSINTRAINSNSAMTTLILRNPNAVATLSSYNITEGPIYNKTNGYIYVPKSLLSSYKSASNWSTHSARFRALEDFTIDGTIYGELDETKI